MSYKKYIEIKNQIKSEVSIEKYKEKLSENISALFLNPDPVVVEQVKKNLIDEFEIQTLLQEKLYPNQERLMIAIKTGDPKKVAAERKSFNEWSFDRQDKLTEKIKNILLLYENGFYSNTITSKEIDSIVNSYTTQSLRKVNEIGSSIDLTIDKIKWHNHNVLIEAIYPDQDFTPTEALVSVGSSYVKSFIVNLVDNQITNIPNDQLPKKLKEDCDCLMENLFKNSKEKRIISLYFNTPINERKFIENIKKEIVLGVKQYLPYNTTLKKEATILEGQDAWKVTLDESNIKRNGDVFLVLSEDVAVKWIKRI